MKRSDYWQRLLFAITWNLTGQDDPLAFKKYGIGKLSTLIIMHCSPSHETPAGQDFGTFGIIWNQVSQQKPETIANLLDTWLTDKLVALSEGLASKINTLKHRLFKENSSTPAKLSVVEKRASKPRL